MSPAEREQLIAMSPAGRISHYLKKKIAGTISTQKYEECIAYALSLPYTTPIEETGEVRIGDGQPETHNAGEAECDDYRAQAGETFTQESFITALERDDKSVLSGHTNGSGLGETNTHTDIIPGYSQNARVWRLLQDGAWHDANEIQLRVYGADHLGSAAIPTRVSNINAKLREKGKGEIKGRVKKGSLWEWRYVEKDGFAETVRNISSG